MTEATVHKPFNFFIRPIIQIVLMFCTAILLFSLSYYRMKDGKVVDMPPSLCAVEEQKNYLVNAEIKVGLFVRNFLEFDILTNNFVADAYVWFEFDPHRISLKAVEDFYFGKAVMEQKSHAYISQQKNKERVGYNVQIRFQTNLDYRYFPIDSHRLYLTLNNAALQKHEAIFISSENSFQVAPTVYASGWSYQGKSVKSGLQLNVLDQSTNTKLISPRTIFALDFANESFKRFILIILPLFIIFFLSLFTLSIDPVKQYATVVSIPAAMMGALVSYFFVIESMSPKVGYFTLADIFFSVFVVLNFMIFILDTICIKYFVRYRGLLVIMFHGLLISAWLFLLYWW